jgi:hypothetical protein
MVEVVCGIQQLDLAGHSTKTVDDGTVMEFMVVTSP